MLFLTERTGSACLCELRRRISKTPHAQLSFFPSNSRARFSQGIIKGDFSRANLFLTNGTESFFIRYLNPPPTKMRSAASANVAIAPSLSLSRDVPVEGIAFLLHEEVQSRSSGNNATTTVDGNIISLSVTRAGDSGLLRFHRYPSPIVSLPPSCAPVILENAGYLLAIASVSSVQISRTAAGFFFSSLL